jgi:hypothetical protein
MSPLAAGCGRYDGSRRALEFQRGTQHLVVEIQQGLVPLDLWGVRHLDDRVGCEETDRGFVVSGHLRRHDGFTSSSDFRFDLRKRRPGFGRRRSFLHRGACERDEREG